MLEEKIENLDCYEKYKVKDKSRVFSNLKTKLKSYLIPIAIGTVISIGCNKAVANNSSVHYEAIATQNGDVNGNRKIDVNDVNYLLAYLYSNGKEPVPIVTGLPVTGQTKCYDNENEISCPNPGEPFYGQDGNYQAGAQRKFEVVKPDPNDKSTWYTKDYITGLMWQYADDGVSRGLEATLAYCENLELGGFNDWRLPNIRELESIIDYGRSNPSIDPNAFETNTSPCGYLVSTAYTSFCEDRFVVCFWDAEIWLWNGGFVRAVRTIQNPTQNGDINGDRRIDENDVHYLLNYLFNKGPAPFPIVTGLPVTGQTKCYDNEKEIPCPQPGEPFYGQDGNYQAGAQRKFEVVKPDQNDKSTWYTIDYITGLMWQYADDLTKRNWQDALSYCENLELGDFNDWRLPSVRELFSIVDFGRSWPALDTQYFDAESLEHEYRDNWAISTSTPSMAVYLDSGFIRRESATMFVRAVRTIQPEIPQREKTLEADLNNDGIVNLEDLAILGEQWLMKEPWYENSK